MAQIPNSVIVDFVDLIDHHNFRIKYITAIGNILISSQKYNIEDLDHEAQTRLREKLSKRISPAKR